MTSVIVYTTLIGKRGFFMDITTFLIIAGFILIGEILYMIYHFWIKQRNIIYKNAQWDSTEILELSSDDINFIKQEAKKQGVFGVDDTTWNDLDMDILYQRMNICLSTAGDQTLYGMLRSPLQETQTIENRKRLMKIILNDEGQRNQIRSALLQITNEERTSINALFDTEVNDMGISIAVLYLLSFLSFASIVLSFFMPEILGIAFILGFFNYVISIQLHKRSSFAYISALQLYQHVRSIHALSKANIDPLFEKQYKINKCSDDLKKIRRSFFVDFYSGDGLLLLLLGNACLLGTISYHRLSKNLKVTREAVEEGVRICGDIDALIAVSAYQHKHETCEVQFIKDQEIHALDMVHPLLEKPVANDVHLSKHQLISGSNASGKSTYLKMIAINCMFAQNFGFAFAKSYQAGFFHVYTSMSIADHIDENDSYFVAEIKSIKRIMDALDQNQAVLCMIDEILRGTNTGERIAAASEILMQFVKTNSLCLSATHDIELTKILQHHYHNLHFSEVYMDERMIFTYKAQEGPSDSQNAISLLETLGFDQQVVNEAREQIHSYTTKGEWMSVKGNGGVKNV